MPMPVGPPDGSKIVPVTVATNADQTGAVAPAVATSATPVPEVVQVKADKVVFPRGEPTPARKAFNDVTAHSSFDHDPQYAWISGEAQKWRNEWRLRYAAVDQVDRFGGSLKLAGDAHLEKLRDGEHYKLQGQVIVVEGGQAGTVFQIEAVEQIPH